MYFYRFPHVIHNLINCIASSYTPRQIRGIGSVVLFTLFDNHEIVVHISLHDVGENVPNSAITQFHDSPIIPYPDDVWK